MIAGRTWRGADGTLYSVVFAREVKPMQPRWWIDSADIPEGDRMAGPASPNRLHLLKASECVGAKDLPNITLALVMP